MNRYHRRRRNRVEYNLPFPATQPVYLIDDRIRCWVLFKCVKGDDVCFKQFGRVELIHCPLHMYGRRWRVTTMTDEAKLIQVEAR